MVEDVSRENLLKIVESLILEDHPTYGSPVLPHYTQRLQLFVLRFLVVEPQDDDTVNCLRILVKKRPREKSSGLGVQCLVRPGRVHRQHLYVANGQPLFRPQ